MGCSATSEKLAIVCDESNLLPNLAKLLETVRKEFDVDREVAKALLSRAASLLRVEIDRQMVDLVSENERGLAAWQIRRLNDFIEARLDQPIRLKDLSTISKLSTAYFCRAFKRTFHETAHSHIVRRRLEYAESLMLTSDLTLSDIALRCGFTDQAHLCKLFRRQYAQSPAVWRRERTETTRRRAKRERPQDFVAELH
ncbi:MAG TPA: AraC family transcriptional regulator [Rhizomicrobium sp.]|jgi:AraC-like DNA-binding protein|nr:AraC family transcriptional regulator [Rhizomicrobium sp.]